MSMDLKLDYKNTLVYQFARQCELNKTDIKKLYNDFLPNNNNCLGLTINDFSNMIKNIDSNAN